MTEAAQAVRENKPEEKEADHHPYFRPKDAATLILVDRSGAIPKVLVGRRHDKVVFMPGKFVFPGGRVDKADYRVPVAASIPQELEANLLKGSPKITVSRAKSLLCCRVLIGQRGRMVDERGPEIRQQFGVLRVLLHQLLEQRRCVDLRFMKRRGEG